jgi:hypothetical protein
MIPTKYSLVHCDVIETQMAEVKNGLACPSCSAAEGQFATRARSRHISASQAPCQSCGVRASCACALTL